MLLWIFLFFCVVGTAIALLDSGSATKKKKKSRASTTPSPTPTPKKRADADSGPDPDPDPDLDPDSDRRKKLCRPARLLPGTYCPPWESGPAPCPLGFYCPVI